MELNEYQELAMRTQNRSVRLNPDMVVKISTDKTNQLICGGLGISEEAGELSGVIKKMAYHDVPYDRDRLAKELGDVFWYACSIADAIGINAEEVCKRNVAKLAARHPEGYSSKYHETGITEEEREDYARKSDPDIGYTG